VLELVSLSWERIQVTFRLRALSGPAPDRSAIRLERVDIPGPAMQPTRAWLEDGETLARFNVMLGPGRLPLEPGQWALAVEGAQSPTGAVRVASQATLDLSRQVGHFIFSGGEYRVVPRLDHEGQRLVLDVSVQRSSPEVEVRPLWRRLWRRLVRRPTRRLLNLASAGSFRIIRALVRHDGRRILFVPYDLRMPTGNVLAVQRRMVERGLDRTWRLLVFSRPTSGGRLAALLYEFRMLALADTIVVDEYHRLLRRVAGLDVRVIQLWHATAALKAVGYSRIGTRSGPSPRTRGHRLYTYAIASAEHDVPLWAETFGLPEERVIPTGIPRMDRFFDPAAREAGREAALQSYPQARGRIVILFAPTFRGPVKEASYDLGWLDFAALHRLCTEKDAVFIIRMHPLVRQRVDIPEPFRDRLVDGTSAIKGESPELLFATDLLITDYSSIMFDYATQGRPMLFFVPDLDTYQAERGLSIPSFEDYVPGRIVRTFDELVDAIRRDDYQAERLAPFRARHFAHLDGGSTDRVIDLILSAAQ
jgi:CDP-ribitol ribitolphosphotransferase